MPDTALAQSIEKAATGFSGRVGVCAQTVDGKHNIEVHAEEVFPAASSIKMYVLYTLLANAEKGEVGLDQRIEFTADAAKPGSGVLFHLDHGLRLTLKDLATLMMMISDNSALILLSEYLGLDAINSEISRLGLEHTRFGDWGKFETDWKNSLGFGQGTPREFVEFLLRMRADELLSEPSRELFWDTLRIQKYIEPLRRRLPASPWAREFGSPEPVWVASKSGVLDDCVCESGFVSVNHGGWAISVMIRELPVNDSKAEKQAEQLISDISFEVFEAWAPLYKEEKTA